jgi:hypothetical protein
MSTQEPGPTPERPTPEEPMPGEPGPDVPGIAPEPPTMPEDPDVGPSESPPRPASNRV